MGDFFLIAAQVGKRAVEDSQAQFLHDFRIGLVDSHVGTLLHPVPEEENVLERHIFPASDIIKHRG